MGALALLAVAAACSSATNQRVAEWNKNDPIGTPVVTGHDTSYLLTTPTYDLLAPSYGAIWNTRATLDEESFLFRRVFGVNPPHVTLVMRNAPPGASDAPRLGEWRERPAVVIPVPRDTGKAARNAPPADIMASRYAPRAAARDWLRLYADSLAGADSSGVAYSPPGATPASSPPAPDGAPGAADTAARTDDDTSRAEPRAAGSRIPSRFPSWFEVGAVTYLSGGMQSEYLIQEMASRIDQAKPLDSLFTRGALTSGAPLASTEREGTERGDEPRAMPPGGIGPRGDWPGGRQTPLIGARRMGAGGAGAGLDVAEATSFFVYLTERGHADVVSRVARGLARGEPMPAIIRALPANGLVPNDPAKLDADWRKWMVARAKEARSRHSR